MQKKNGFTLLEVTLGMIALSVAAVSMQRLLPKRESQAMQVSSDSRRLATALRTARQIAIARQTQVRFRLIGGQPQSTGFAVESLTNGNYTLIFQEKIAIFANAQEIVFSPSGSANTSLRASVGSGTLVRQVELIAGSGMVRRDEP